MRFVKAVAFLWSVSSASSFGIQRQSGSTATTSTGSSRHNDNPLAFATKHRHNGAATATGRLPWILESRGGHRTGETALSASVTSELAVSEENLKALSERGRKAVMNLLEYDTEGSQAHVYGSWPDAGVDDEGKKRLAEQVRMQCLMMVGMLEWKIASL